MTVLSLLLAGPLQSWGSESRFTTRATDDAPTKSGVLGLLAAARGQRRTDPIEDLLDIRFGVRIDQPGEILRDFQTARSLDGRKSMPLSQRFYRADARYLVGLDADRALLEGLVDALLHPVYPLYLGRRSCPPSEPLVPTLHETSLERFLLDEPWQAAPWWKREQKRRLRHDPIRLQYRIDAEGWTGDLGEHQGDITVRDIPLSFDPEHRQYGWRSVRHGWIDVGEVEPPSDATPSHDPMAAVD